MITRAEKLICLQEIIINNPSSCFTAQLSINIPTGAFRLLVFYLHFRSLLSHIVLLLHSFYVYLYCAARCV